MAEPQTAPQQEVKVSGQLNVAEGSARQKRPLKGVVNPELVRVVSFTVITISLVASTVLCILAIWSNEVVDTVIRAIATFIVVIVATAIFTVVNEKLG